MKCYVWSKKNGSVAIHESTWRQKLSDREKEEISERYGTTPLEFAEWTAMLAKAGAINIISEFEEWSNPEVFWKIRKNRDVKHWFFTMDHPRKINHDEKDFFKIRIQKVF